MYPTITLTKPSLFNYIHLTETRSEILNSLNSLLVFLDFWVISVHILSTFLSTFDDDCSFFFQPWFIMCFQGYDDDSDEKRTTNMNMGPRTWYQVPSRDLRYPEVSESIFIKTTWTLIATWSKFVSLFLYSICLKIAAWVQFETELAFWWKTFLIFCLIFTHRLINCSFLVLISTYKKD